MSEQPSDEAVSLCIRTSAPANLCQELIDLLGSVETAEAFIKACATQGDIGLPTPKERQLLVVGDPDRRERIRKSLLGMAMISGAMPIGFGVPREGFRAFDDAIERANIEISKAISGQRLATSWPLSKSGMAMARRPLAERKVRRAKRKQRSRR